MAAAELKLQVGLDLGFFRQQLAQLGSVAVGYQLPINIKLDRLSIQQELNRLATNISRRKYKLEVATNIKSETEAAQKLDAALDALKDKEINVKFAGTGDLNPKEARKIRAALRRSVLSNGGKIKIPATIQPSISNDEVASFRKLVQEKFKGITVTVGVEPQVSSKGAAAQASVKGQGRPGGYETALESLQRLNPEQLRNRAVKSLGEESRAAQQISNWVDILQANKGMGRGDKNKQLAGIREFLAKALAESVGQGIEARMTSPSGLNPARRGAFPYVAKTGPIEPKVLFAEAAQRAAEIDAQAAMRSRYIAQQQESLRSTAGRFLPSAKEAIAGGSTQSQAVKAFYDRLRNTERVFAQNFSANSYLPAATRSLASAMDGAAKQLRVLSTTRIAGALPSGEMINARRQEAYRNILSAGSIPTTVARPWERKTTGTPMLPSRRVAGLLPSAEMMAPLRFRRAAAKAAEIDAVNAARRQEELKVKAENAVREKAAATRKLRESFAGLPPIQAPSIGQENAPLSRAATYSLNKARRLLGMPIGPSSAYSPNPFAGAATVPPRAQASGGFALPPAGTTSNYSSTARSAAWAQVYQQPRAAQAPSAPPPMGGGIPPTPPGPPIPPTPPGGGRGGFGSFGGFGGAMPNVSLPGAGLVRELGDQFGYAAKQVLLFGAAYKALAFLTEFPAKVGEAVAQLQTFRNTLQSITPNADEFQKSNQFILDTVDKYNTPLQSARDGFTKLYASMAPAGFKGDDIRNIFAGISQGAATFGMSADKVDRVNYAFAQMASKGQVMSEELKGQLGDVLPGAVAIFAKAAGFEGPEAMVKFTKAMEDGRYKGEAMKQLLINVGIVMKDKFAAGAEGAAQTFQGQMNAMANATKKLYEAFVPAGNLFSSQIIAPFTSGLQVLAEGFNAFFSGVAAKTAGGFAFSQELEKLRPTIKGIMDNITQLMPVLQSFATTLLGLGKILLQIAGNPFVGYLLRVYLAVLPLTMAIQALNLQALVPMIASFVRAIPIFTAYQAATLQGASANKALQQSMVITGQSAGVTAGKIRLVGTALKSVFVGTLVGAVALGIGMIIEKMATLSSKMAEARANALQLGNSIRVMSKTELQVAQNKLGRQEVMLRNLQTQGKGQKYVPLNKQQENMLMELAPGAITRVTRNRTGLEPVTKIGAGMGMGMAAIDPAMVQSVQQKIITLRQNIQSARADLAATDQTATVLAPIPSASGASVSGGGAKPRAAARIPLEQLLDRNSSRAAQSRAAALDLALNERILQAKKDGNEQEQASLENLRPVIKARGELAALTEFHNMLVRNEAKIVGKSLTQAQFDERLRLAGQKMTIANINLENEYVDLRKKDLENNKQILDQQEQYQRTLEDIKIKNGEVSDEEVRRLEKLRQYQDILKANPSLTDLQKTDLLNAINAAPIDIIGEKLKAYRKNLDDMLNTKNQIVGIAESIGDSFGASFKGIIDGSMTAQQALASFFQNLSNYFADAVSKMIAEWLKIEAIKGLKSLLPNLFGGGAGFAFTGDSGLGAVAFGSGFQVPGFEFANGGIAPKGFQAFATGGIVTGPTLGLVGEGRYNEAVIPLPDGKSVPVDLGGEGARLGGNGGVSVGAINITVQNTGDTLSPAAQKQIAGQVQGIVLATMADQRRSGGMLR